LAQDLAVAALEGRGTVARPAAWLERVGRNTAIDRWRVERRREALMPDLDAPGAGLDPEAALLRRERRSVVRSALGALPRPQRRAALLRFHGELPFDEVAARLGTGPATARTRVHRALVALRARVSGLRALFFWPGAPAVALGLAVIAANLDAVAPPSARPAPTVLSDGAPAVRPTRHFARTRLLAAEAAPAATAGAAHRVDRQTTPAPAETQRFDFDDDEVTGDLQNPDGILVPGARAAAEPSLIELRRHFVPEMLKSLEDL
jgi:RNA polymerase sigma factor (sigma-70 family)